MSNDPFFPKRHTFDHLFFGSAKEQSVAKSLRDYFEMLKRHEEMADTIDPPETIAALCVKAPSL